MEPPDPADAERIRTLKASYFRLLDTKQWPQLRRIFTADAAFDGFSTAAGNPDDFLANLQSKLATVVSIHQGFGLELAVVSDGVVRGICAMSDYLVWPVDAGAYFGLSMPGQWGIRGYGYYEDEFRRTDDGWLISYSRLVRIRIDPQVGEPPADLAFPVLRPDPHWLEPSRTPAAAID